LITDNCDSINEEIFVGIDPSLTGTGIVVIDQSGCIMKQELISTCKDEPVEARMLQIQDKIKFIRNIVRLKMVYIEGPSYASRGNVALQLGAIHFLIRIFLYRFSIKFKIIAPKSLKLFHTGRGDAKKKEIVELVNQKFGTNFTDHNLADAYGLARMALEDSKE
jgi:crossover junction endodeoxyribonuclease RuvC